MAVALIGALALLSLLFAAPASADFEHVGPFATNGGASASWHGWMLHPMAAAVNTTGAGGVPKGTLYAVTEEAPAVARFNPDGSFAEAWGWGVANEGEAEFQRCGPDGEATHPECTLGERGKIKYAETEGAGGGVKGEGAGQLWAPLAVAIDQTTGYVYVLTNRQHGVIQVYSADGSQLIASFGERGKDSGEHFNESPEKIHTVRQGGLAVNASGEVYVYDHANFPIEPGETRAMVFKPHEGDYEQYEYAGRGSDIAVAGNYFAMDDAGNLYVSGFSEDIHEFSPSQPSTPICSYKVKPSKGMKALTVDPQTGEPYYYNYKTESIDHLSACNSEGLFVPVAEIPTVQLRGETAELFVEALAFDPAVSYSPSRPAGILYSLLGPERSKASGEIFALAEIAYPSVESESALGVGTTAVTLRAQINPRGYETHYAFEYLTQAEYEANPPGERFAGAAEAPPGGTSLGSGSQALGATAGIAGLQPGTEYRFRVVASSHCNAEKEAEVCETPGEALAFRTYPPQAPGLADHRAYELVSPARKYGGEVFSLEPGQSGQGCFECNMGSLLSAFAKQGAPDGESVVYEGTPFAPSGGAAEADEYLARRTPSGWQTTNLTPELLLKSGGPYKAFDPALDRGVIAQESPALAAGAPAGYGDLYLQTSADPLALSPLLTSAPPNRAPGPGYLKLSFDGGNADYTHLLFGGNDALTAETPFAPAALDGGAEKFNLYEWTGGQLRLVNVLPGNSQTAPGAVLGRFAFASGAQPDYSHAVSDDGSRVFWSDEAGDIYLREAGERTLPVSASQRSPEDPLGSSPASYLTASSDGSRVLFSSSEELTQNADTGLGQEIVLAAATAGTFKLAFEGQSTGATGSGDLAGTTGSGDLVLAASGSTGDVTAGSASVANVTNAASFSVGMAITALGIPTETHVIGVDAGAHALTLSTDATQTTAGASLTAGDIQNAAGSFAAGQALVGQGIRTGTTIAAVTGSTLTPSQVPAAAATGVALTAGSTTVSDLSTATGAFTSGEAISGAGIAAGTTIVSCSPSCGAGATSLRLSAPPSATASSVALSADLPFNAGTGAIEGALEALPSIGAGGVTASSRNGNPAIAFAGSLGANDSTPLTVDGSGLTGTVQLRSFRPGDALYEWHEGALTDLTPAGSGSLGFQGIAGQSEDLSRFYFVDSAVLTGEEENEYGAKAEPGEPNLYAWREGATAFVATLGEEAGDWAVSPSDRYAEASPDGRWLAFYSRGSLTGYENHGPTCTHNGAKFQPGDCDEAFLYDSASGRLLCASCSPTGVTPIGTTAPIVQHEGVPYKPQPRFLTNSGRLAFNSQDSLVPADTNEGAEDVYEWEPDGVGSCESTFAQGGCVNLISAGREVYDSDFFAMDESGRNIFFTSRDQLVLRDTDELYDLYDAREGGGFAAETETARQECQGEACQPPVSPPNDATPASSAFEGAGNVVEGRAKKKRKHAKKKKHASKHGKKHERAAKRNRGGAK